MNKLQRFGLLNNTLEEDAKKVMNLPYQNPSYKFMTAINDMTRRIQLKIK